MSIQNLNIKAGIEQLSAKLKALEVENLAISDYNKFYLNKHKEHLTYNLTINGLLLQDALQQNKNLSLVCDYGAGTGLLGFLAQESLGCKVIYTDIYPSACKDLPIIASAIGLQLYQVVQGDISTLNQLKLNNIDAILSRDVIEHIYDLKAFFELGYVLNPKMIQVHNTAANVYNVLRKKEFKKIHINSEWYGDRGNLKETDTKEAFYEQRFKMIKETFPAISNETTQLLASNTRGLVQNDIETAVSQYLEGKTIIKKDKYLFNTCDPNTGNWAERLLYFDEFIQMAEKNYTLKFTKIPYNTFSVSSSKRILAKILNSIITILGHSGRYIWPSFNIILKPKSV